MSVNTLTCLWADLVFHFLNTCLNGFWTTFPVTAPKTCFNFTCDALKGCNKMSETVHSELSLWEQKKMFENYYMECWNFLQKELPLPMLSCVKQQKYFHKTKDNSCLLCVNSWKLRHYYKNADFVESFHCYWLHRWAGNLWKWITTVRQLVSHLFLEKFNGDTLRRTLFYPTPFSAYEWLLKKKTPKNLN